MLNHYKCVTTAFKFGSVSRDATSPGNTVRAGPLGPVPGLHTARKTAQLWAHDQSPGFLICPVRRSRTVRKRTSRHAGVHCQKPQTLSRSPQFAVRPRSRIGDAASA